MPDSFGARLRQRRERQQIGLNTIADQTKISLSLLEALERDDVSHWPAGIFRRSFIRSYAHAVGLEPDVVVREFLELHPDPIEVLPTSSIAPAEVGASSVSLRPPTRLRYLVGSAIGSLSRLGLELVQTRAAALEVATVADSSPARARSEDPDLSGSHDPDLSAAAHLCTQLGRVEDTREAAPLLQSAARILEALGLIVWVWDPQASELKPALAHGYSDTVLARLPRVRRDTDNATASAFRSAQTCVVNSSDRTSGALVIPLMTPMGCVGVLALELQHGSEQRESVRALATMFAAQLASLVGTTHLADATDRRPA
jgi:transcriptional regulator with XRE-family HTH domain